MTPTLRDLAEDAFAYMDGPNVELDRRAELVLRNDPTPHPMFGLVLRPRLRDVDRALAETRAWFADRGRTIYTWFVSTASTPSGLAERLLDRGLEPDQLDPVYARMTLEHEPEGIEGVEVRRRETYEEALAAHRARYELWKDDGRVDGFIALVDGEIVGSSAARYFESGVAEEARGRGVYRALVDSTS